MVHDMECFYRIGLFGRKGTEISSKKAYQAGV